MRGCPPVPQAMTFMKGDLDTIVWALASVGNDGVFRCGDLASRIVATGVAESKEDQRLGQKAYAHL